MSEPVFVEKSWVEKVDAELKNDAPPQPVAPPPSSRFYDVRPAVLYGGWTWNEDASSWSGKIRFIINGERDATSYDVYAPTFLKTVSPPVTNYSSNPRVYVVWRGRWEVVAFVPNVPEYTGGDGIDVDNVSHTISNSGIINAVVNIDGTSSGSQVNDGTTLFFAEDDFRVASRNTDSGSDPCLRLSAKRTITIKAGKDISINKVQTDAFSEYTISSAVEPYVWPGINIIESNVSGKKATSINIGSGGNYSPVSYSAGVLLFRTLSEIEVVTSAYINASGDLVKTTERIWAYRPY